MDKNTLNHNQDAGKNRTFLFQKNIHQNAFQSSLLIIAKAWKLIIFPLRFSGFARRKILLQEKQDN
jgi:hypothetical protein